MADKGDEDKAAEMQGATAADSSTCAAAEDAQPQAEGLNAHLGPLPLKNGYGTLTAADRSAIMEMTQCSAAVRMRSQWGERALTITGPPHKLQDSRTENK